MDRIKEAATTYRGFVTSNRMLVNAVESAIQGLAFLVPSTLPDHELLTEACHALSGLFATFNHSITLPQESATTAQNDILRSLISFTINVEVFAEKLGERFGSKDSTILVIECLKAAMRLRLRAKNQQCMQTNGEKLEAEKRNITWDAFTHFCDERLRIQQQQQHHDSILGIREPELSERVLVHTGARSGIRLRVPRAYANPDGQDVLRAQQLREKLLQQSLQYMRIGEVLHILRPVVYAALKYVMNKRQSTRQHAEAKGTAAETRNRQPTTSTASVPPSANDWIPWVVSLLMELTALYCTAMAISIAQGQVEKPAAGRKSQGSDSKHAHPFERELQRRKWLLAWYLLRPPLFETGVRPVLQAAVYIFGKVPLLGGLFRYITNLPEYLHRHHFYTSGSS